MADRAGLQRLPDIEVSALHADFAAKLLARRETFRQSYRELEDEGAYWVLIDLVGSTAFRETYGHEAGYIQGETFLQRMSRSSWKFRRRSR